ncbi:MAG: hypothetical protein NTY09_15075 [bacterium]|nr:hypothetical protein [bacterium]
MHSTLRFTLIIAIAGLIIAGCSGHNSAPVAPDETISPQDLTGSADVSNDPGVNSHYLLSSGLIYVNTENPNDPIIEIIPAREGEMHLNILKFLEVGPCSDCFRIVGFNFPGPGYENLNVDIRIDHPFNDLLYSAFDVRGIIMFNGSHEFPAIDKTTSDPSIGEGSLLNADGYTALYNASTLTAPVGDLQKYFPGKLSTATVPNSDINGYIYFRSDDPANNRNAFYADSFDVKTFSMKLPTEVFVIGYAVDASWWLPVSEPVDDPLTDFGADANCTEPWKIEAKDIGPGLTEEDGSAKIQIDVYDWQGNPPLPCPTVQGPEVASGGYVAAGECDGDGYARYEVDISNSNNAPSGDYICLVSAEAKENDPIGTPWLDLTAYQLINLQVTIGGEPESGDLLWAKRAGGASGNYSDSGSGITTLSDNSTVVTGWFSGSATFGPGEPNQTVLTSAGDQDIFIARYNPYGSLTWVKSAGGGRGYGITTLSDNSTVVTGGSCIARYNPDGTLAWAKSAGGSGEGITTLSDNSTVVTGWFIDSATFGPGEPNETILTSDGSWDIFIARYGPDGTLAWAKRAGGATLDDWCSESGYGITTLSDNSAVVTGMFNGSATFGPGEPNETILAAAGESDIFIARYNPDGTLAWAKSAEGASGYDWGKGITTLSDNSTVVTGWFIDSATFGPGEPNETILTSAGGDDIFIARYNPDGTLAWAKRAGGASDYDRGQGITTLSDNSTVVTGYFEGSATFGPGEPNETILTAAGSDDIFIARYNPDGTLAWVKRAGGPGGYDSGWGITTLSDNSTVVSGSFFYSVTFGLGEPNETVLTSAGYFDIFIARFAP